MTAVYEQAACRKISDKLGGVCRGLALIISVILSGEGWGGGGFGSMTESGVFLGPVWFSVSGPDHLQSFCWPVLRVPENCMKVEQSLE